ncbi:MAG: H-NS histone family protein [Methylococcales bacterium]|nr:H-NS histone family protein [Methylococcales bacterium]
MTEYTDLSDVELQNVIDNAEKALKERVVKKRKEVIAQIKDLADSIGMNVVLTEDKSKMAKVGKKVPPKYQNPDDKSQTWTGRGVAPKWMQGLVNDGRDRDEFLIN